MPVPLAAAGIAFGSMRCHDDTFMRTPCFDALVAEVGAPRPHAIDTFTEHGSGLSPISP